MEFKRHRKHRNELLLTALFCFDCRPARMLRPLQSRTKVGPLQQPMRTAHPEPGEDLRGNMREQHESQLTTHGASKSEPSEHTRMIQNATAEQTERLDKSFDMSFKKLL